MRTPSNDDGPGLNHWQTSWPTARPALPRLTARALVRSNLMREPRRVPLSDQQKR
jgi:hypothetical protein